jgi:hypothetical protein
VVSRKGMLQVFWISRDGSVITQFWPQKGKWSLPEILVPGDSPLAAVPGAGIDQLRRMSRWSHVASVPLTPLWEERMLKGRANNGPRGGGAASRLGGESRKMDSPKLDGIIPIPGQIGDLQLVVPFGHYQPRSAEGTCRTAKDWRPGEYRQQVSKHSCQPCGHYASRRSSRWRRSNMQIRSQVRKDQRVVLFVSATAKQVVRDYSSCARGRLDVTVSTDQDRGGRRRRMIHLLQATATNHITEDHNDR